MGGASIGGGGAVWGEGQPLLCTLLILPHETVKVSNYSEQD